MKHFPSLVPGSKSKSFQAEVFEKLDGQNFCIEYTKKRGFYKFGSRTQMVDETDLQLGKAVILFKEKYIADLERVFRDNKLEGTIFAEYWGDNSLGGIHDPNDEMKISYFDFSPRGGIVASSLFRKLFENKVPTAKYLGTYNWTPGFVARVRAGELGSFEGVVGKENSNNPYMAKAKTQAWLDAVKLRYGEKIAEKISDE